VLLVLAVAIMACATNLEDLRYSEPIRADQFHAPHDRLATCTKQRFDNQFLAQLQRWDDPAKQEIRLAMTTIMPGFLLTIQGAALFDIRFLQHNSLTLVQLRSDGWYDRFSTDIWAIVEACAKAGS